MVRTQRPTWADFGLMCAIVGLLVGILISRNAPPTPPPLAAARPRGDAETGRDNVIPMRQRKASGR